MQSITTPGGYVIDKPIDIILITCNRLQITIRTVEELYKRIKTPFRLIVVDDMSVDGTPKYLQDLKDKGYLSVYEQLENSNICQAYNKGFEFVESDYFITMQDDITPPELDVCVIQQLIDLLIKYPDHAGIGCRIQRIPNMDWQEGDLTPARKSLSAYFRIQHRKDFKGLEFPFGNRQWDDIHFNSFFTKKGRKCSWANNLWADHSRGYCLNRGYLVKPRKWGTGIHGRIKQDHIIKPYPAIDPKTNVPLSIVNADKKVDRPHLPDKNIFGFKMRTRRRYYDNEILNEELNPEKNIYRIPENPKVVIDVGAHIGGTSLWAAKAGATVFAFEPELYNFETLKYNVRRNKLHESIHCFNLGVGKSGRAKLFVHWNASGTASSYPDQFHGRENEAITQVASFISIRDVFNNYDIDHCDVLKLDCEGSEEDIIRDLDDELVSKIDQISVEFHQNKLGQHELIEILKKWYDAENIRRREWVFRKKV